MKTISEKKNAILINKRNRSKVVRNERKLIPEQYELFLKTERLRESNDSRKSKKKLREGSESYKLKAIVRRQKRLFGNSSTPEGLSVYLNAINKSLRKKVLEYLRSKFSFTTTRKSRQSGAISVDNYGREFLIQTQAFCDYVNSNDYNSQYFCRIPYTPKYSVPELVDKLEDIDQVSILQLSKLVDLLVPEVFGLTLYLIQAIVYDGDGERGAHTDGLQNGGDVIVGCDIGGGRRQIEIGKCCEKNYIFDVGEGSIYVMSNIVRYVGTHNPKKLNKKDNPYVIMLRYGLPRFEF